MKKKSKITFALCALLCLVFSSTVLADEQETIIKYASNNAFTDVVMDLSNQNNKDIVSIQNEISNILHDNKIVNVDCIGWKYVNTQMGNLMIIVKADDKYLALNTGIVNNENKEPFISYVCAYHDYYTMVDLQRDMQIKEYNEF